MPDKLAAVQIHKPTWKYGQINFKKITTSISKEIRKINSYSYLWRIFIQQDYIHHWRKQTTRITCMENITNLKNP